MDAWVVVQLGKNSVCLFVNSLNNINTIQTTLIKKLT